MTKSAPKFDVNEIKCNGSGGYSRIVSEQNQQFIKTYISVYRKSIVPSELLEEFSNMNASEDYYWGRRCDSNDDVMHRAITGLAEYAMEKWEGVQGLAELWLNAQIRMMSGAELRVVIKEALRDCASADHWYTFEKDWN